MDDLRKCLAEFVGTFFFCFAGIGTILSTEDPLNSGAGLVGIALAHGLAVAIAVCAFGGISGAHINPAVTIGMLVTGRIGAKLSVLYIVAQCLASVLAAFLCTQIYPAAAVESANLGIPLPPDTEAPEIVATVLLAEIIMTFLLVTAVFGTAVDTRGMAAKIGGLGIGLVVTIDILAGMPITGASMNPARSFGPALIQGDFTLHWCYWVAPIVGACIAALMWHQILLKSDDGQ